MTDPRVRIAELEDEMEGLHTHADLVESDRSALLMVVEPIQEFQGFSVSELLRVIAHDLAPPNFSGSMVKTRRAMWLKDLGDKLDKTLAALPENLK